MFPRLAPNRRQVLSGTGGIALSSFLFGPAGEAYAFAGVTSDELGPPMPFSFDEISQTGRGPCQEAVREADRAIAQRVGRDHLR